MPQGPQGQGPHALRPACPTALTPQGPHAQRDKCLKARMPHGPLHGHQREIGGNLSGALRRIPRRTPLRALRMLKLFKSEHQQQIYIVYTLTFLPLRSAVFESSRNTTRYIFETIQHVTRCRFCYSRHKAIILYHMVRIETEHPSTLTLERSEARSEACGLKSIFLLKITRLQTNTEKLFSAKLHFPRNRI